MDDVVYRVEGGSYVYCILVGFIFFVKGMEDVLFYCCLGLGFMLCYVFGKLRDKIFEEVIEFRF